MRINDCCFKSLNLGVVHSTVFFLEGREKLGRERERALIWERLINCCRQFAPRPGLGINPATEECALHGESNPWPFGPLEQANALTTEKTGQRYSIFEATDLYHSLADLIYYNPYIYLLWRLPNLYLLPRTLGSYFQVTIPLGCLVDISNLPQTEFLISLWNLLILQSSCWS